PQPPPLTTDAFDDSVRPASAGGSCLSAPHPLADRSSRAPRSRLLPPPRRFVGLVTILLGILGAGCGDGMPEPDPTSLRQLAQGEVVGHATEAGRVHAWRGL